MALEEIDLNKGKNFVPHSATKELPKLNEKMKKFALHLAEGKSAAEAYRIAYDYNGNNAWQLGSPLAADPRIQMWMLKLQEFGVENGAISLNSHLNVLAILRNMAISKGQNNAAINAEKARGQASGHYVERVRHTIEGLVPDDELVIEFYKAFGPEMAKTAAKELGVDYNKISFDGDLMGAVIEGESQPIDK